jgi:hypothetical protein
MEGDYGPGSIDDASGVISGAVGAEVLPEVFSFDADGNFIDIEAGEQTGGTPQAAQGAAMHTNAGASAQVRLEHEEGQRAAAEVSFAYCITQMPHLLPAGLSLLLPTTISLKSSSFNNTNSPLIELRRPDGC